MTRIAQIADLHFGREIPHLVDRLVDDLWELRPTMVAVCGDLTQRATESEFVRAQDFLDRLPGQVIVVPGNHDLPGWRVWSRFARPWRRWRRHIGTGDPYAIEVAEAADMVAVGINTARRWGTHPDWSRGRISARQLTAAEAAFNAASPTDLRVVVTHHPFLLTRAGRYRGLVGGSARALGRLRERADLLLGGHIHLGYSGVADGLVVSQTPTAFSNRLKGEPNGYNLIEGDREAITVTVHRWQDDAFTPGHPDRYIRAGDTWHPHPDEDSP